MIRTLTLLALAALLPSALIFTAAAEPISESRSNSVLHQDGLPPNALWLESLALKHMKGAARVGETLEGTPLTLYGRNYAQGIGCSDYNALYVKLHGAATRFEADFGVDDAFIRRGTARAYVFVDGKLVDQFPDWTYSMVPKESYRISVDLADATDLFLVGMSQERRSIFMDWAGARLLLKPEAQQLPEAAPLPDEQDRASFSEGNPLWPDAIYHAFYTSGDSWVRFGRTPESAPIILSGSFSWQFRGGLRGPSRNTRGCANQSWQARHRSVCAGMIAA